MAVITWPVIDGNYVVGDRDASVAVCTLTTSEMVHLLAAVQGVAIAGQVMTANLGIERIVTNVTANPSIRFLLLCGKDSKIFRPGQSLQALADNGVDGELRIVDAQGYEPVLPNLSPQRIEAFRRQVELVDWSGEEDIDAIKQGVAGLAARTPGVFDGGQDVLTTETITIPQQSFTGIRPGGQKEPLLYDPKGYFVITLDREEDQVVLRHFHTDHTPAHEMRGRVAESMLRGLIREDLISQLSHAGYLGAELAKAEAALRLNLRYEQDRPLRRIPPPEGATVEAAAATPPMPRITPPQTWQEFEALSIGGTADIVAEIKEMPAERELTGIYLAPTEANPFSSFQRTEHRISAIWSPEARVVMGTAEDIVVGAFVRLKGTLRAEGRIEADGIVILSSAAEVR